MSAEQAAAHSSALEWDQADRMRKALRVSGVSNADMAEYLGVSRNSVSAWITGTSEPRVAFLRLFAMRTGVPFEWLKTGKAPSSPDGDDGAPVLSQHSVRSKGLEPPTFCSVALAERAARQRGNVTPLRRRPPAVAPAQLPKVA